MTRRPFTCHDCGDTFTPADDTCATGYAVLNDEAFSTEPNAPVHKVCYECSCKRDLADAAETGKLFAYVNSHAAFDHTPLVNPSIHGRYTRRETIDAVTTWPGLPLAVGPINTHNTWRSNFGDVRTAFTCQLATGLEYSENGLWGRMVETWHGIAYAGNGGYCRLRRAKVQS